MKGRLADHTQRCNFPYLHGIYLAINAIRDAYLLVDGPNCAFFKAEHVFGSHDLVSTLLDSDGRHRIANTDLHADKINAGHEERVRSLLERILDSSAPGVVFVGALPMASITGIDYEGILSEARSGMDRSTILLPARSLDRDWLTGYADVLRRIAEEIDLAGSQPRPERVAVIGHFMDRTEEDQQGNVREIRRILGVLGLEVVSVWLDGGTFADLQGVREAGWIVGLPHGRSAAETLANRTGARLIQTGLPFGIDATDRFIRTVGEAVGREKEAEDWIGTERRFLAPRWERLIPKRLAFRTIEFYGDPHFMPGILDLSRTLGMHVRYLGAFSKPVAGLDECRPLEQSHPVDIQWEPRISRLPGSGRQGEEPDLIVGNSHALEWAGPAKARLEFGFPSRNNHYCFDAPFLGYRGALNFVDRIANEVGDWVQSR